MFVKNNQMQKVLLIDNYDSFVYNLKQLLDESGLCETTIVFNDKLNLKKATLFDRILISPGPGLPIEAGSTIEIIKKLSPSHPILGICLGCQAIVEVYGGKLFQLDKIYHGHQSELIRTNSDEPLFVNIAQRFKTGRYHSWGLDIQKNSELNITSRTESGLAMSVRHKKYNVCGLLFHPESIMTPAGKTMIENWLRYS